MNIPYEIAIQGRDAIDKFKEEQIKLKTRMTELYAKEEETKKVAQKTVGLLKDYLVKSDILGKNNYHYVGYELAHRPLELYQNLSNIETQIIALKQMALEMIDNKVEILEIEKKASWLKR